MDFNFFTVLEKDNKELIHSSFMRFLLGEDSRFAEKFLGIEAFGPQKVISLEKSYLLDIRGKNRRCRLDIEIVDGQRIIIIENKFKSFPDTAQLAHYDQVLDCQHPGKHQVKFLLCFDKNLFAGHGDWIVKDYSDLSIYLAEYLDGMDNGDKKLFITHYYSFLKDYLQKYETYLKSSSCIFLNQSENENKFWLRLLYSHLKIRLDRYFAEKGMTVGIGFGNGNASIPLMDIVPEHWILNDQRLLLQVQNGELKFYGLTKDKVFLNEIIAFSRSVINNVEFKKMTSRKEYTAFIFKLNIHNPLQQGQDFNLDYIYEIVIRFLEIIEERIIVPYLLKS